MFKKENLATTGFILLIIVLIGAAVFGVLFKDDEETASKPLKTTTDMAFVLEDQPFEGEEDAPITLTLFFDYNCSHCGQWEEQIYPAIKSDVLSTGKVNLRFVNYPFMNITSTYAAMGGEIIQDKNPEAFSNYHHDVFSNQLAISLDSVAEKVAKYVPELSKEEAKEAILDQSYIDPVLADKNYAALKNVSSTPTLFVGKELVKNAFDTEEIQNLINKQLKKVNNEVADEGTKGEEDDEVSDKE